MGYKIQEYVKPDGYENFIEEGNAAIVSKQAKMFYVHEYLKRFGYKYYKNERCYINAHHNTTYKCVITEMKD